MLNFSRKWPYHELGGRDTRRGHESGKEVNKQGREQGNG